MSVSDMADASPESVPSKSTLKRVCVFCGSSPGNDPDFIKKATEFGELLASNDIELVYGGGNVGMMGAVSEAVIKGNGKVHGVIPAALTPRELSGDQDKRVDLEVVGDMHTRKKRMAELADAFVALPGGYGTLEELFEVVCWSTLGINPAPIAVLNVNGFYDPLYQMQQNCIKSGFIHKKEYYDSMMFFADPAKLLEHLKTFKPDEGLTKW